MIFSNTGIALLAYMDGIETRTLGGVVLAAAAAAGSAIYKVFHTYKISLTEPIILNTYTMNYEEQSYPLFLLIAGRFQTCCW